MLTFPVRQVANGLATPSGAATTIFIVPHSLGKVPLWCGITPGNVLSAALFDVGWDSTNITVTYMTAITGALSLQWIAIG
jgi:hypothetical protein